MLRGADMSIEKLGCRSFYLRAVYASNYSASDKKEKKRKLRVGEQQMSQIAVFKGSKGVSAGALSL